EEREAGWLTRDANLRGRIGASDVMAYFRLMITGSDPEELSALVVDAAFHIHDKLGPGLLESVYTSMLARALQRQGLKVEREKVVVFEFDGMQFNDGLRIDLLVNDALVVELKSVEAFAPVHFK